ncbi:MAG: NCS2 family permease [Ruminococcaceae bacterium]|nr:NCS2 family permease [Oscillospiraceae bacterium]
MNKKLDNFFKISERGSNVRTEITAGLTTFFAMAYIVVTNPNQVVGFTFGGPFDTIWNAVYVASILVAVIGTLLYALYAKLPFAQACGMGLNSFFFVSFILPALLSGSDPVQGYRQGLCIILLSGVIFLILSITGARKYIAKALPDCLKKAIPAGIGLFIAFIGFKNVGIIQANQYTFVQFFDFHGAVSGQPVFDAWKAIAPVVLALLGLFLIAILDKKKVKGSIIITILTVTVLYYLTTWTKPDFDLGKIGQSFKDFGEIGFLGAFKGFDIFEGGSSAIVNAVVLTITFCLVDMFDTIGTLYGTASQANMLDENGDPVDIDKSMAADSVATVSGAVLGTSTCTTFVESAAGVAAGGRTGLASLVTSICFAVCLFLTPVAAIVPACATAPALIFVGVLMLKNFAKVDMSDISSAVPAFLALIMMPLTYSISNGIAIGAIAYTVIRIATGKFTKKDIVVAGIAVLFTLRFFLVTM